MMKNDLAPEFRPGIYQHYKGGTYAALMMVAHHETREPMVVYTSLEKGNVQVREWKQPYPQERGIDAWTDVVKWEVSIPTFDPGITHAPRFIFIRGFA